MDGSCVVNGSFRFLLTLSRLFGLAPIRFYPVEDGFRIELMKSSYYEYIFIVFLDSIHFTSLFFYIISSEITEDIHVISLVLRILDWIAQTMFLNIAILSSKVAVFARYFLIITIQVAQNLIELKSSFIKFEIHKYMETIKFELMDIIVDIKSDKKPKPPMCDICISVGALSKAFVSTCNTFFKYNTKDNVLAVILSLMFTVNLVGTVYNFAVTFTSADYEYEIMQSCLEFTWMIFHIFRAILYVEASYQMRKEVDIIRHQLGQLSELVTSDGKATPSEVDIFQLVVLGNYPETNPMGFFTVSRELLIPILSTFFTYGIFMIQISSILTKSNDIKH
ncbi:unnamed protein product [Pieris brassicae]|uniref:Gustatory receptor n=1 Tax=Pieris brassicae TaxID=7116 RepID=A0A9P0T5L3_PIEBR|nr:unnamed protein product [Pieris brassicae]